MRADAARNRARIIEAATEVFAEQGLEASTAAIAQRAGVGEATVFRRFPSKDDLILALVVTQMDAAIGIAEQRLADPDPWRGIERFFTQMIEQRTNDRGVSDAAKAQCITSPSLDERRRRLMELMTALVERGQEAGVVREDLRGSDLGLLGHAAAAVSELPFAGLREDLWKRYLGIILDGIRPEGATKLRRAAPSARLFERPETDSP